MILIFSKDNRAVIVGLVSHGRAPKTGINNPSFYQSMHKREIHSWVHSNSIDGKCPKMHSQLTDNETTPKNDSMSLHNHFQAIFIQFFLKIICNVYFLSSIKISN